MCEWQQTVLSVRFCHLLVCAQAQNNNQLALLQFSHNLQEGKLRSECYIDSALGEVFNYKITKTWDNKWPMRDSVCLCVLGCRSNKKVTWTLATEANVVTYTYENAHINTRKLHSTTKQVLIESRMAEEKLKTRSRVSLKGWWVLLLNRRVSLLFLLWRYLHLWRKCSPRKPRT